MTWTTENLYTWAPDNRQEGQQNPLRLLQTAPPPKKKEKYNPDWLLRFDGNESEKHISIVIIKYIINELWLKKKKKKKIKTTSSEHTKLYCDLEEVAPNEVVSIKFCEFLLGARGKACLETQFICHWMSCGFNRWGLLNRLLIRKRANCFIKIMSFYIYFTCTVLIAGTAVFLCLERQIWEERTRDDDD